jgi:hypothetical protein
LNDQVLNGIIVPQEQMLSLLPAKHQFHILILTKE